MSKSRFLTKFFLLSSRTRDVDPIVTSSRCQQVTTSYTGYLTYFKTFVKTVWVPRLSSYLETQPRNVCVSIIFRNDMRSAQSVSIVTSVRY